MIHCISIGLLSSFGVFQQAYTEVPEFAGSSAVAIAFIGSLGSAGLPLFSIMAGRLADKYTPCIVCSCGALIVLASLVIASFATEIWHLFIAQGFLLGMGASLTYIPGISIVSDWFIKRRGVAVGIAAAGAGAGGLILGPLLRALISKVGWRWTLRLIGVGGGGILLISAYLLVKRTNTKKNPTIDLSWFKDKIFLLLYFSSMVSSFAYFVPFFFIPTYSIQHGLTREQGALLVGILNGASGVGRIVLGFVADYIGATNAITMCATVATLLVFGLWPVATTFSTILTFVLLFGFFVGGSAALMRTVVAHLFGSKGNIPTITGLNYSSSLFGFVAGPPIVGALIDAYTTYTPDGVKHIGYIPAIMFCAYYGLELVGGNKSHLAPLPEKKPAAPAVDSPSSWVAGLTPATQDDGVAPTVTPIADVTQNALAAILARLEAGPVVPQVVVPNNKDYPPLPPTGATPKSKTMATKPHPTTTTTTTTDQPSKDTRFADAVKKRPIHQQLVERQPDFRKAGVAAWLALKRETSVPAHSATQILQSLGPSPRSSRQGQARCNFFFAAKTVTTIQRSPDVKARNFFRSLLASIGGKTLEAATVEATKIRVQTPDFSISTMETVPKESLPVKRATDKKPTASAVDPPSDMAAEVTPAIQDDGVAPTVTPIADVEMCL
ncbi:hypothetical protein BASA84_000650 [Batrachochytrium salamandrivorans]|nr:hypothetical protein BASA84_000650 [Batrachochytrium salamandrivorans]